MWLFFSFNFERNYVVLKSKSPCILWSKNRKFEKDKAESKLDVLVSLFFLSFPFLKFLWRHIVIFILKFILCISVLCLLYVYIENKTKIINLKRKNFPFLDFSNSKSLPTSSFFRSPKYNIPSLEARPGPPANI